MEERLRSARADASATRRRSSVISGEGASGDACPAAGRGRPGRPGGRGGARSGRRAPNRRWAGGKGGGGGGGGGGGKRNAAAFPRPGASPPLRVQVASRVVRGAIIDRRPVRRGAGGMVVSMEYMWTGADPLGDRGGVSYIMNGLFLARVQY